MAIYTFVPWEYACSHIHNPSATVRNQDGKFKSRQPRSSKKIPACKCLAFAPGTPATPGHQPQAPLGGFKAAASITSIQESLLTFQTLCKRDGDSPWGREKASLLVLHAKRTSALSSRGQI